MPKTIVIAPDSFKESLSAQRVAASIARGIMAASPDIVCVQRPIADGGEGTVDTILSSVPGTRITVAAHDPLLRPIEASYALIDDNTTAVVECAAASGLELLKVNERNPMRSSSFGTGELIRDALDRGVTKIIIGIGGSATNDAAAGIAQALGIRLLNRDEQEVESGGAALPDVASLDFEHVHPRLKEVTLSVACDVNIPLYGASGSSLNYSKQKGASQEESQLLEQALQHFGDLLDAHAGRKVSAIPGAGAAGGMGAGLVGLCGAELLPGLALLAKLVKLEEAVRDCDLVVTGEGRIDAQTLQGKAPSGVATMAAKYGKNVVAFCGSVDSNFDTVASPFAEVIPIKSIAKDTPDALQHADDYLVQLATAFARRWNAVLD